MKTVRNWCYGAKTPDIEKAVSDAIFEANRYRNQICELERAKRQRLEDLLLRLAPNYVIALEKESVASAELEEALAAIKAEKVKQRTKKPKGCEALQKRVAEIRNNLKDLRYDLGRLKKEEYESKAVSQAMKKNNSQYKDDCKRLYNGSELYWGTKGNVREACGSFCKGGPPNFKRYDGTGQISYQIINGIDCESFMEPNTHCYLENVNGKKADCLIRVGSTPKRKPVFVRVPIIFHRPLPQGKVKRVHLERRKIASHIRWTVRLVIQSEWKDEQRLPGEVAVHVGWRMEAEGLRVCTWLGSDGETGKLHLSHEHCADYTELDEIASQRDVAFNKAIAELRVWLKSNRDVPDWLSEARRTLHLWKAKSRLAKLVVRWRDDRSSGDAEIFQELENWRKQDKRDWQHRCRLSKRISRRRKDLYRNFVSGLAKRYGVAVVSPIKTKELNKNSPVEDLEPSGKQAHRHSQWAAVSEMVECVKHKYFVHCLEVSPENMSRQCVNCGHLNDLYGRKCQCAGCGTTYDVDENAVANTLARGEVAMKGGGVLANIEKEEEKRETAARNQKEKEDGRRKEQAARKQGKQGNEK